MRQFSFYFQLVALLATVALVPIGDARAGPTDKKPANDLGSISLWDVSGITGPSESYENQLGLTLSPAVTLGRLVSLHPLFDGLRLSAEFSLSGELSGNDDSYRGGQFANPTFQPGGAEALELGALGTVEDAASGQVEGTQRRALVSDLWFGLAQPELVKVPWLDIDVGARLALALPTSLGSRNAGMRSVLGLGLDLSRTLFSRLDLGYSLRYAHYFFDKRTSLVRSMDKPLVVNGVDVDPYQPNRATMLNPNFALINEFSVSVTPLKDLSLSASYALTLTYTYALPAASLPNTPLSNPCADGVAVAEDSGGRVVGCGNRAQRDSHWFRLSASYKVLPMLAVSLGLSTLQPVRHEGGGISNPFVQTVKTTNYTTLEAGLRLDIEPTISAITGHGREDQ